MMRGPASRFALLMLLFAVVLATGCSGAVGDRGGTGDGLHKTVPRVVGMTQADASSEIMGAGYEVGSVSEKQDAGAEKGTVVSQEPIAGTSLARGSEVNLVVAAD